MESIIASFLFISAAVAAAKFIHGAYASEVRQNKYKKELDKMTPEQRKKHLEDKQIELEMRAGL